MSALLNPTTTSHNNDDAVQLVCTATCQKSGNFRSLIKYMFDTNTYGILYWDLLQKAIWFQSCSIVSWQWMAIRVPHSWFTNWTITSKEWNQCPFSFYLIYLHTFLQRFSKQSHMIQFSIFTIGSRVCLEMELCSKTDLEDAKEIDSNIQDDDNTKVNNPVANFLSEQDYITTEDDPVVVSSQIQNMIICQTPVGNEFNFTTINKLLQEREKQAKRIRVWVHTPSSHLFPCASRWNQIQDIIGHQNLSETYHSISIPAQEFHSVVKDLTAAGSVFGAIRADANSMNVALSTIGEITTVSFETTASTLKEAKKSKQYRLQEEKCQQSQYGLYLCPQSFSSSSSTNNHLVIEETFPVRSFHLLRPFLSSSKVIHLKIPKSSPCKRTISSRVNNNNNNDSGDRTTQQTGYPTSYNVTSSFHTGCHASQSHNGLPSCMLLVEANAFRGLYVMCIVDHMPDYLLYQSVSNSPYLGNLW